MADQGGSQSASVYVLVDTAILSYLSKASPQATGYQELIGERRLAVSFQTLPELDAAEFGPRRKQRVDDLLAVTLQLPHSEATNTWYARVAQRRQELRKSQREGGTASDADVWIISSALEHGLPLISHDRQQVQLGRAVGLRVATNLEGLKEDNPSLS